ncbi:hypothetical protein OG418_49235 [Streptomyces phaeochromogenes]|uniref:hypothetical protein n=1 Tax=Streptomyces phaeochromogenes TaxID=1923 RepID=UPI003248C4CD
MSASLDFWHRVARFPRPIGHRASGIGHRASGIGRPWWSKAFEQRPVNIYRGHKNGKKVFGVAELQALLSAASALPYEHSSTNATG